MTYTVQQLIDRLQRHADTGKGGQLVAVLDNEGDASEVRDVDDHDDYLVILADKDPRPHDVVTDRIWRHDARA